MEGVEQPKLRKDQNAWRKGKFQALLSRNYRKSGDERKKKEKNMSDERENCTKRNCSRNLIKGINNSQSPFNIFWTILKSSNKWTKEHGN